MKLKRFGKFTASWLAVALTILSLFADPAGAVTPTTVTVQPTPPPSRAPNVVVTSIVGSALPDYIELFSQADAPLDLAGWKLTFTVHDDAAGCADTTVSVPLPGSWLLSRKYLTLERTSQPAPGDAAVAFTVDTNALLAGCTTPKLSSVSAVDGSGAVDQTVVIPSTEWSASSTLVAQHKQRNNSLTSTRNVTGIFDTDYKFVTGAIALNSDPLYTPPADANGLQILEILPNPRSCSPVETDLACSDYIKLYNPTGQPINLALYRLRTGHKGQSDSVTNTFTWGADLDPAQTELLLPPLQYFMLMLRNDGQPLSVTDSGGYVWLEDAYGTKTYDPIVQYPDASSTTKVGQAWAYDGTAWRWTAAPEPGAANYFPPEIIPSGTSSTPSILKPCAVNQYRNPATNRCKSIVVTSSTLVPCQPGQERNPDTSRCRAVVASTQTLAPCQTGWERNPDTNRCRKAVTAVAGDSTLAVKDVAAPSADNSGWFVALLVIALALGYAAYEWHQDIQLVVQKVIARMQHALRRNRG